MNTTIWKYELLPIRGQRFDLPVGARVLSVGAQGDRLCMWLAVNPDAPTEQRWFRILGTGWPVNDGIDSMLFHGTAQMDAMVWHVFERRP